MTIDELIIKKHIVRMNTPDNITEKIDGIIKSVLLDEGIVMKIIGTDYIFPRILQTSKGEKALIWDQTYWEIYSCFLLYLADLNVQQKESKVLIHANGSCSAHPKILIPFSYYLALIVEEQSLSINFAKYYSQRCQEAQFIRSQMSQNEFSEYIEIAKMYVAVHEQMHFKYKHDNKRRSDDIAGMTQSLDIAYELVENFEESFCQAEYLKSKHDLLNMVKAAYLDSRVQEELLCDTYALNNCLHVCRQYWSDKFDQKEIVTKCFEAIRIVDYFNSLLISLKIFWEKCSCDINEIDEFHILTAQRNYLSEIMAAIQLAKQRLYGYDVKSLWKFDGFENNYSLENIIYSNFFSKAAIEFWRKIPMKEAGNKSNIADKFKLLDWRI